ncbi:MAG: galactose mutarotase [Verrucomicrobiae bacterium]|nr:galactose mutarotase [Verrucomicrobiae bacterium]
MKLDQKSFGRLPDGSEATLFTVSNARGVTVRFTNYGLIITEFLAPGLDGRTANIVLGFDTLDRYLKGHPFFGAIAGRVANRIAKGQFTLDGKTYQLAVNNGPNHLHGGQVGYDKKLWKIEGYELTPERAGVRFGWVSPDGDEGYPGTLTMTVTYSLDQGNDFRIHYLATTDKATPINLTNHSYFNLAGRGSIDDQVLEIAASRYTEVDDGLIPTGKISPVAGTPLDFTSPKRLGDSIQRTGLQPPGYDHNFVLDDEGKSVALAARVRDPASGRILEVLTDRPGVQLYTANHFPADGYECNGGLKFPPHGAFCLETQNFPDAINKPHFPKAVLRPGETYDTTTIFRTSIAAQ